MVKVNKMKLYDKSILQAKEYKRLNSDFTFAFAILCPLKCPHKTH